jgi:hypothetical protein
MRPNEVERDIKLWDAATGRELRRFDFQDPSSTAVAFSADDRVLFVGDYPATRAWDTETGKEIPSVARLFRGIRLLALFPDGKSMIASDQNGSGTPPFAVYEVNTGKERVRFDDLPVKDMNSHVNCFALSPDGRLLAAAGGGGVQVYLWDTRTGKRLGVLDGHNSWVMALAFAPDGKSLASASNDTTVLLWDLARFRRDHGVPARLTAADVEKYWEDLASAEASRAYQAMIALADVPDVSMALVRARVRPALLPPAESLAHWISNVDSPRFVDRENASRALAAIGELAVPDLEKALRNPVSAEARRRLEDLLERAHVAVPQANVLRDVRAIEILDRIGTQEARAFLTSLARGAPQARLTQDAKASLARLVRSGN